MTVESESLLLWENPKVESSCQFGILTVPVAKFVELLRKWLLAKIQLFYFYDFSFREGMQGLKFQCHFCGSRDDFMYQYLHTGSTILAGAGFCLWKLWIGLDVRTRPVYIGLHRLDLCSLFALFPINKRLKEIEISRFKE